MFATSYQLVLEADKNRNNLIREVEPLRCCTTVCNSSSQGSVIFFNRGTFGVQEGHEMEVSRVDSPVVLWVLQGSRRLILK